MPWSCQLGSNPWALWQPSTNKEACGCCTIFNAGAQQLLLFSNSAQWLSLSWWLLREVPPLRVVEGRERVQPAQGCHSLLLQDIWSLMNNDADPHKKRIEQHGDPQSCLFPILCPFVRRYICPSQELWAACISSYSCRNSIIPSLCSTKKQRSSVLLCA